MKDPSVYELEDLVRYTESGPKLLQNSGYWVPARPEGLPSILNRISLAWEVFTGKADVVRWPGGQ